MCSHTPAFCGRAIDRSEPVLIPMQDKHFFQADEDLEDWAGRKSLRCALASHTLRTQTCASEAQNCKPSTRAFSLKPLRTRILWFRLTLLKQPGVEFKSHSICYPSLVCRPVRSLLAAWRHFGQSVLRRRKWVPPQFLAEAT